MEKGAAVRLAWKKAIFEELELIEKDDEELDAGYQASMAAMKGNDAMSKPEPNAPSYQKSSENGAALTSPLANGTSRGTTDEVVPEMTSTARQAAIDDLLKCPSGQLERSQTAPERLKSLSRRESIIVVKDTPNRAMPLPSLPSRSRHLVSNPQPVTRSTGAMFSAGGVKRKKSDFVQLVPEGQRLFADLKFFFVPNNAVNKARKMRIDKAIQYGAIWHGEWHEDVTHIVVDKEMSFQDVLKVLRILNLPNHVTLVNERWPGDCLMHNHLLNPRQPVYQVMGHMAPPKRAASVASSAPSEVSLQLKPVRKRDDVFLYDQTTPSRTEDSVDVVELDLEGKIDLPEAQQEVPDNKMIETDAQVYLEQNGDAFKQALAETKATGYLPMNPDDEGSSRSITLNEDSDSGCAEALKAMPRRKSDMNAQQTFQY